MVSVLSPLLVWQEATEGFWRKAQSDVSLTMLTLAALRWTEQIAQDPEWRLGAQAGVSLACSRCFLCIIFQAHLQSVPGQTVLVCLETPLLGSREPCRAQNSFPIFPSLCFPFLCNASKHAHTTVSWTPHPSRKCSTAPTHRPTLFRRC